MIFSNKKAQITAFIIMGILLIAMVSLFFLLKKEESSETGGKTETNVRGIFESCLEEDLKKTVKTITEQGGYLSNPLNISFIFKEETKARNISYLCYTTKGFVPCVNQEPMLLTHLEIEIGRGIHEEVRKCFDEVAISLEKKGEFVEANYEGFGIELAPREIRIIVDGKIASTKSGQTTIQEGIEGHFQTRLYEITNVVQEIVSQESTNCNFENLGFMLFYPEFEIDKIRTRDSTMIYTVKHKKGIEKFNFAIRGCVFPPVF